MSFQNSHQKKIFFIEKLTKQGIRVPVIDYFLRTSNANKSFRLARPSGVPEELGDGTFLFSDGKSRTVGINYFAPICNTVGSDDVTLCSDPTLVHSPTQRDFTVSQVTTSVILGLREDDIRQIDFDRWDFNGVAMESIAAMLPDFREQLAKEWIAYAATKLGKHPDGNAQKKVPPAFTTAGALNPFGGRMVIEKEYSDANQSTPYILGGDEAYYMQKLVGMGGLQDTGINVNRMDTSNLWYDKGLLNSVLGDEANGGHMFAIDPTKFKLITFNKNAGLFRTDIAPIQAFDRLYRTGNGAGFSKGTFYDEVTGLYLDMYVNFNKCASWNDGDPGWSVFFQLYWDMFVLPMDVCNIPEFNGLTHWRTCPVVYAACPEGVSPSPAVEPTEYSWTPGNIFTNLVIYDAVIAGVPHSWAEGVSVANVTQLAALMNDATGNAWPFRVDGSDIEYDGVSAISVNFNGGAITGTFS